MSPGNSSEQTVSLEMSPNDKDSLTGTCTNEMVVTSAAIPVNDSQDRTDFKDVLTNGDTDGTSNNNPSGNVFADRQNIVRGFCDASLMAANVSQLRAVLDGDPAYRFFTPLLVLIGLSLILHIGFGLIMIQRWRKARKAHLEHMKKAEELDSQGPNTIASDPRGIVCACEWCATVEWYDEISIFIVFFVIVLNVVIAVLGLRDSQ
ncbi:ninjurin-1 [Magallana gigas]|uniref:ninjurin-1 n=1 Tax=Magallana gigas TaxID=29159 RepID=UPI00333FD7A1